MGHAGRLPLFFALRMLLRRALLLLLLLLPHTLQLLVDLLWSLDSVGIVRLAGIGGGRSILRACIRWWDDGTALGLWARRGLHGLDGGLVGLRAVVEGGSVWVGRSGAALARSENQL